MKDFVSQWLAEGHFRIVGINPKTNEHRVLVDRKNMVMQPATTIAARAITGLANSKISHLYLGYNTDGSYPTVGYTLTPSNVTFPRSSVTGFLRIPLTFTPTLSEAGDGSWTMMTFHTLVNQPDSFIAGGAPALTGAEFFEAALVSQTNPNGGPGEGDFDDDLVFSRVAFERLAYDPNFNLSISWGIKLSI